MNSRLLLNLVLAALAAVLVLVVVYRPGIEPEAGPQPLTGLASSSAIETIRIERREHAPLVFTKEGDDWMLQHDGTPLPASGFQLQSLLRLPQATSNAVYEASTLDLEQLGLEPPLVSIRFDDTNIRLGDSNPMDRRRYARFGDNVLLVEDNYQHLVNADWSNFVSRRLLPEDARITQIELPGMTLSKDGHGKWTLQPQPEQFSADAVTQLVGNWQTANALYVKRYADGTGEAVRITVEGSDTPLSLLLLSNSPELVLANPESGIQYHLPASLEGSLLSIGNPDPAQGADNETE